MITPAVLISASGTMILSTSTRLGRVVDRVRSLKLLIMPDSSEHAIVAVALVAEQLYEKTD